jgi:hypothetical protein
MEQLCRVNNEIPEPNLIKTAVKKNVAPFEDRQGALYEFEK